jgi:hypothetical protein
MKYTTRYYDRNPLDPAKRWEIHRAVIEARDEAEVMGIIAGMDCEFIDAIPEADTLIDAWLVDYNDDLYDWARGG